jgi:uncharacterized membrane protein YeiH
MLPLPCPALPSPAGANTINGALAVYAANLGKPKQYWLHSLVLVICTAFGGGIITPILLGRPAGPLANEAIIPMAVLTWYIVHYLGSGFFYRFLNLTPVKLIWNWLMAVFRANSAVGMVTLACTVFKPSVYYPTPLFGPLIAGTIVSCGGAFLPFDKGGSYAYVFYVFYVFYVCYVLCCY